MQVEEKVAVKMLFLYFRSYTVSPRWVILPALVFNNESESSRGDAMRRATQEKEVLWYETLISLLPIQQKYF